MIQIIEEDEDYIQALKDENAILTERIKALEAPTRGLSVMDYMRACRDVCNHAIGYSPLSDLVKDEKEKAKYKGISYAYCEERVYLFKIPSGAIVLCKGPNPLDAWKNSMENKV